VPEHTRIDVLTVLTLGYLAVAKTIACNFSTHTHTENERMREAERQRESSILQYSS
jgi:hypothetical protein